MTKTEKNTEDAPQSERANIAFHCSRLKLAIGAIPSQGQVIAAYKEQQRNVHTDQALSELTESLCFFLKLFKKTEEKGSIKGRDE